MAFTDLEIAEHGALIEQIFWSKRRPSREIRDQIREGQRFAGQNIEFFFVRPLFNQPDRTVEDSIAKVQFVRGRGSWRIFWKRADGKWHGHRPHPEAASLTEALQ